MTATVVRLPRTLTVDDPAGAVADLRRYFGDPYPAAGYTGAWFDEWDSTGSRFDDRDRFTADDLVAITLLSVEAGGRAARAILHDRRDEFASLLESIGPDRDLADEPGPITSERP